MSNRNAPPYIEKKRAGVQIEMRPDVTCLSCLGPIARENIHRELRPSNGIDPDRRVLQTYCEFCDMLEETELELHGGQWIPVGGSSVVRSTARRERFLRRIAQASGERRDAAPSLAGPSRTLRQFHSASRRRVST